MAQILTRPKEIAFSLKTNPLTGIYVDGTDRLKWKLFTTGTFGRYYLRGRLINARGELVILNEILDIPSGIYYVEKNIQLEEGYLQDLLVRPSEGLSVDLGDVFTIVSLVRGVGSSGEMYETTNLIQNYVSTGYYPSYPKSDLIDPIRAEGHKRVWLYTSIPAQNTTFFPVPRYAYYKLLNIQANIFLSSTVGDRYYNVQVIDENQNTLWSSWTDTTFPANTIASLRWGFGENFRTDYVGGKYYPIPFEIFLRPNYQLVFRQFNYQTGDRIIQFVVFVEKRMSLV